MNETNLIEISKITNKHFLFYANIILMPVGIVLNIISLLIIFGKKFNSLRIGICYQIITLSDIAVIIFCLLIYFLQSIDIDIVSSSDLSCKLMSYFMTISLQISPWTNALLTIDRFLTINFPKNKFDFFKNKKNFNFILFALITFIFIVNSPNVWLVENLTQNEKCFENNIFVSIKEIITFAFRIVLPFSLIFVFNVLLIRVYVYLKRNTCPIREMRKELRLTFSVIVMNVFYFINIIPLTTIIIYYNLIEKVEFSSPQIDLTSNILFYVSIINHCLPFMINIVFNKMFQVEMSKVWRVKDYIFNFKFFI